MRDFYLLNQCLTKVLENMVSAGLEHGTMFAKDQNYNSVPVCISRHSFLDDHISSDFHRKQITDVPRYSEGMKETLNSLYTCHNNIIPVHLPVFIIFPRRQGPHFAIYADDSKSDRFRFRIQYNLT